MLIGVDIGGTFTDLVLSADGQLHIHKVLSTPDDPARGMLAGLGEISPGGLGAIDRVSHGSTVATNAILERKGGRVAVITTQGFRDLLAIGRQNRPQLYALQPQLPPPLIPRRWCYQVPERLDHTGRILEPLDTDALDAVLDDLAREEIQSVAVCFLYSYLNPAHEQAVRARILERGILEDWQIALSSEVLPEFREYERASTVSLEAYVRPVMSRYLGNLEDGLPKPVSLRVMTSEGGVMSAGRAREHAIHTALSGPAAGVIGGFYLAKQAGFEQVITLDMGGTSTDVSLCPGEPVRRAESEIDGLPLRTRLLDIETIGAGGGSIARLDAGGALRVGPESAGADPGPIVYGQGGERATVTDANAVLGRMDPDHFLGGAMRLHLDPAREALSTLGREMGRSTAEAALGVIHVANVNIDRALRRVSVARGYDPRDFTLVAFGGAGPLHACEVAEALEIPRVLIPRYPGVLCAFGLLMADVVLEESRSVLGPVTPDTHNQLTSYLEEMRAQARAKLRQEGVAEKDILLSGLVDARYQGQSYELTLPFTADLAAAFHAVHAREYGHALRERTVEMVNLRLQATGLVEKPTLAPEPVEENDGSDARLGQRDGFTRYKREALRTGAAFPGPALVFQLDSTVYIPQGWSAKVDGYRNLIVNC
ncbi:MAG: Acetophenone carboxylase gamma subunit [Chloroflexi bacterium]|nr:Acetophenone carboxylase gamma subunit [Chloroflexota bacterium]